MLRPLHTPVERDRFDEEILRFFELPSVTEVECEVADRDDRRRVLFSQSAAEAIDDLSEDRLCFLLFVPLELHRESVPVSAATAVENCRSLHERRRGSGKLGL